MEFKTLEEAKQYIEVKNKELEDTKKQLEELTKSGIELKSKNDELIRTNSKLLSDIVNMGNSNKNEEGKEEKKDIPDKESFFKLEDNE